MKYSKSRCRTATFRNTAMGVSLMIFMSGCAFLTDYFLVDVSLPPLPNTWDGRVSISHFTVKYVDEHGMQNEASSDGNSPVSVRIAKNAVSPVVAVPVCTDPSIILKPAGALVPLHVDNSGNLTLTWLHGFLSALLFSCAPLRSQMQAVNAARLSREIISESGGNPWRIDPEPIREGIATGTLTSSRILLLPDFDLTIPAENGVWLSANPLDGRKVEWADGTLRTEDVPMGFSCYFMLDRDGTIHLQVDEAGWMVINSATGHGESGSW